MPFRKIKGHELARLFASLRPASAHVGAFTAVEAACDLGCTAPFRSIARHDCLRTPANFRHANSTHTRV